MAVVIRSFWLKVKLEGLLSAEDVARLELEKIGGEVETVLFEAVGVVVELEVEL